MFAIVSFSFFFRYILLYRFIANCLSLHIAMCGVFFLLSAQKQNEVSKAISHRLENHVTLYFCLYSGKK